MRVREIGVVAACALLVAAVLAVAGDDEKKPTTPLTRVVTVLRAEDEKPIEGATVDAVGLPGGVIKKTTDKDGVARFPFMPWRGVTFVARLEGRFPAWYDPNGFHWASDPEDEDTDGDGVTALTLGLTKGTAFDGRVVANGDGSPIAGATVTAEQQAGATDQFELSDAPTWTAVTDAEGRFRTTSHFPEAFKNEYIDLLITVRAPGWISEHVEVKPGGERHAEFKLLRAARLRGTVKDAEGTPVAGALVHAYPPDCGVFHQGAPETCRADESAHPRVLEAITDAHGRYEMPELHPGVKFFVYAERMGPPDDLDLPSRDPIARSDVTDGVGTAAAGEETVCDLALHTLSTLVVRVAKDAGGDAESIGYELSKGPQHSYPSIDDEEIEGGRKFERLDPGTYSLRVDAAGWLALEQKVDVPEGKTTELTVRLSRGTGVDGVVVDDVGAAVAGAVVFAYPVDATTGRVLYRASASAKTDAIGAFRLTGLPPGPVDVGAGAESYLFDTDVRATAPASALRLVVVRRPFISLRVDAPPHASLPEKLRVTVKTLTGLYAGMRDPMQVPAADLPANLDRLRPGPADVTVEIPGFAPSTLHSELKPGETTPVGPFAFEEGETLAGRVVDATGHPVGGARVTPGENDARTVTTSSDGSFALPHLAPGATELCVVAADFPETRLVAAAGRENATEIVLHPGGVVRGVVTSRDGERVSRRRLCIYDAAVTDGYGPHWHGEIDEDPHFSMRLPAGKYRWVPSRYEFEKGAVVFEVKEGGTTDVAFELPW